MASLEPIVGVIWVISIDYNLKDLIIGANLDLSFSLWSIMRMPLGIQIAYSVNHDRWPN